MTRTGDTHSRVPTAFGAKKAFVLSMPRTMSATEVVLLAKKQGLKLSSGYVYVIRSQQGRPSATTEPTKNRAIIGVERRFREAAAELGLLRSKQVLDKLRSAAVDAR